MRTTSDLISYAQLSCVEGTPRARRISETEPEDLLRPSELSPELISACRNRTFSVVIILGAELQRRG